MSKESFKITISKRDEKYHAAIEVNVNVRMARAEGDPNIYCHISAMDTAFWAKNDKEIPVVVEMVGKHFFDSFLLQKNNTLNGLLRHFKANNILPISGIQGIDQLIKHPKIGEYIFYVRGEIQPHPIELMGNFVTTQQSQMLELAY